MDQDRGAEAGLGDSHVLAPDYSPPHAASHWPSPPPSNQIVSTHFYLDIFVDIVDILSARRSLLCHQWTIQISKMHSQ